MDERAATPFPSSLSYGYKTRGKNYHVVIKGERGNQM